MGMMLERARSALLGSLWLRITLLWWIVAMVLASGSAWLWWMHGVPFARPPHPWNEWVIHLAGPWVIWTASGWLARRSW
jgi:hypothetical protein